MWQIFFLKLLIKPIVSAESNQYGMAQVSILENAVVVNEKVISFVSKGVKAITEVVG